MFCEGRELVRLARDEAFEPQLPKGQIVRFVSFLASVPRARPVLPLRIPAAGEWLVRVASVSGRLEVGEYRRQMKSIGCLGQLDTLFGTPATTRS